MVYKKNDGFIPCGILFRFPSHTGIHLAHVRLIILGDLSVKGNPALRKGFCVLTSPDPSVTQRFSAFVLIGAVAISVRARMTALMSRQYPTGINPSKLIIR